ncbi:Triacylglycerol lipase [Aphelenchoides fujianensis]|nr:Triacylglycerol lipase [Aphelenchoides fujianensis]
MFFLLLALPLVGGTFSDGFRCFLRARFGAEAEANLTRLDLGPRGSFGGGERGFAAKTKQENSFDRRSLLSFSHTPVVIVHGLQNCAGGYHEAFAEWARRGWAPSEIFATSHGPPGAHVDVGNILACDYVRQVRQAHYEGDRVLILESRGDDWVGFETPTGERLCEVAAADRTVILKEPLNHDDTIFTTQGLQFDLLVSNAPYPAA